VILTSVLHYWINYDTLTLRVQHFKHFCLKSCQINYLLKFYKFYNNIMSHQWPSMCLNNRFKQFRDEYLRNAMCAPSSGGKFLLTELMTHRAIVDIFSSQAFCRTFLETIFQDKTVNCVIVQATHSSVKMFLAETGHNETNHVSSSCSIEILQSLNYEMITVWQTCLTICKSVLQGHEHAFYINTLTVTNDLQQLHSYSVTRNYANSS